MSLCITVAIVREVRTAHIKPHGTHADGSGTHKTEGGWQVGSTRTTRPASRQGINPTTRGHQ